MREFKIGDEVVLRPETKPYTFKDFLDNQIEKGSVVFDDIVYTVISVHGDGDVSIVCKDSHPSSISSHHLKYAKEDTSISTLSVDLELNELLKDIDVVELRLAIFNGNTSRTIEEMKEIEEWLLGDK